MVIVDRSANGGMELIKLRDLLLNAQNTAEQLQRQVSSSSDEQITELHGIPAGSIPAYKAVLGDVLEALDSNPVELLLSNIA